MLISATSVKTPPPAKPLSIAPVRETDEPLELFAPYRAWKPRRVADPRTGALIDLALGLTGIVEAEGPILDHRAFALYTRAAGLSRASADVRARYGKAVARAVRERQIAAERDPDGSENQVLRRPGSPAVHLRARADRTLEEIPVAEIAALFRKLELGRGEAFASPEERLRRVLAAYELVRLTAKSKARLESACAMANLPTWLNAITESHEPVGPLDGPRPRRPQRRLRHG